MAIKFRIGPATAWFAETNSYADVRERTAGVYVFCLFAAVERDTANPLDVEQWIFFVASTSQIDVAIGEQVTITPSSLRARVQPVETDFVGLPIAVAEKFRGRGGMNNSSP